MADALDVVWESARDDGGPILDALRACLARLGARARTAVRLA